MSMPMRARPEARESLWISRYKESGYETPHVHRAIMNCRFANIDRTGMVERVGNIERMTWGIVSPVQSH